MSNLILDIGNTRSKIAILFDGEVVYTESFDKLSADHIASLCDSHNVSAVIASVVGQQPDFDVLIPQHLKTQFHLLSYRSRLPISIDYETPETLGMDRVAALVGARELSKSQDPLLVVDAGSCITIDILDQHNVFRGGAIAPGLRMRFRALHDYTAALPLVDPALEDSNQSVGHGDTPLMTSTNISPCIHQELVPGRNTRDSILVGVHDAAVLEIQGFAERYSAMYPSLKLFLTGGDAYFFAKRLFFPNFANPNLVLIGLDKILKMNIRELFS